MAKKTYKRELIEWTVLVVVAGGLYLSGLHTEVIGQIQRLVLTTGIMQPDLEEEHQPAAYDFQLVNAAGRTIHFEEYKGKTVFLNLWATWCPPCVAEMPDIESLFQKKGKEVNFVLLSVDKDRQKAINFVERKGYEVPIYFLKSNLPDIYSTRSIPTTFLISPDGKIAVKQQGMAKYDTEAFRSLLDSLNQKAAMPL
ncbi:TlpA family protein disulfide reductase [Marinoscillum furvescens]|uniref:Thiol-disulfide isomerase/thioredoxin n=1 Tax=Marinoscillum furvescens DSM 4134 TaxID=1122208 RepID=A0A3D9LFX7_MARFU|nr:TlpA disulfide reductase family protein [Marinoscillum furvescens]REE05570.1 thiol-disulfide isomerase/thioredoxin [Marinoscillum furvescens DSM 4134]